VRIAIVAVVLLGCAAARPPPTQVTTVVRPPVVHEPTSGELVDPRAPSLDAARSRVRSYLREVGIRTPPKCVCEPIDMGSIVLPDGTVHRFVGTSCSWYR